MPNNIDNTNADKNYQYFIDNLAMLLAEHKGKYVVIYNETFESFHDSFKDAVVYATEKFGMGNFLIQQCNDPNTDAMVFHSRVCFEN